MTALALVFGWRPRSRWPNEWSQFLCQARTPAQKAEKRAWQRANDAVLEIEEIIERMMPVGDRPWVEKAKCKGKDANIFFSQKEMGANLQPHIDRAKAICNGVKKPDGTFLEKPCPVRRECLEYAMEHCERVGVWGGKSAKERRELKRARSAGLG